MWYPYNDIQTQIKLHKVSLHNRAEILGFNFQFSLQQHNYKYLKCTINVILMDFLSTNKWLLLCQHCSWKCNGAVGFRPPVVRETVVHAGFRTRTTILNAFDVSGTAMYSKRVTLLGNNLGGEYSLIILLVIIWFENVMCFGS